MIDGMATLPPNIESNVAPALMAAQKELERSQLENTLENKLKARPDAAELLKGGILECTLFNLNRLVVTHPSNYSLRSTRGTSYVPKGGTHQTAGASP
jgi:hypothetical protein